MQPTNQQVSLAELKPHPQNYNRHPAEQVRKLAKSLTKFGQVRSIVVWRNFILAGHGLTEAARSLKWKSIRADVLPDDYPEELALAYVAADNELAKQGDPDLVQLAAILEQSRAADEELMEAMGYSPAEYDRLMEELEVTALQDAAPAEKRNLGDASKQIKAVLYAENVKDFERAILATGQRNRAEALLAICRFYLENHESEAERQLNAELENLAAA